MRPSASRPDVAQAAVQAAHDRLPLQSVTPLPESPGGHSRDSCRQRWAARVDARSRTLQCGGSDPPASNDSTRLRSGHAEGGARGPEGSSRAGGKKSGGSVVGWGRTKVISTSPTGPMSICPCDLNWQIGQSWVDLWCRSGEPGTFESPVPSGRDRDRSRVGRAVRAHRRSQARRGSGVRTAGRGADAGASRSSAPSDWCRSIC